MKDNSRLKSLTEDRYTLSDIFIKNNEILLLLPLFAYLITPFIHILVYTFTYRESKTWKDSFLFILSGHGPGDYHIAIIDCAIIFAAFFMLIAIISYIVSQKSSQNRSAFSDYIPTLFFLIFCMLIIASLISNKGISKEFLLGRNAWGEGLFTVFSYYLIFYLCASLVKKEEYKFIIVYSILSISMVVGILSIINKYIFDIPIMDNRELSGIFFDFNFYGYFLTISIMLSASLIISEQNKHRQIFAIIMFAMNSFILAVNNTLGCFVACIVAFLFMIVAQSLRIGKFSISSLILFFIFLFICFIISFFYTSFFTQLLGLFTDVGKIIGNSDDAASAGTARWGIWLKTFEFIREKPLFGHGFGGIAYRLSDATESEKVHNEYLEYAAYYGIPAAFIYICGLVSIYIKALIRRKSVDNATFCCLVAAFGYIVSAFFGNAVIYTIPYYFILLGLSNSISKNSATNNEVSTIQNVKNE